MMMSEDEFAHRLLNSRGGGSVAAPWRLNQTLVGTYWHPM